MTKRILIADDSSYMRGVIKRILKNGGYAEFLEAADGGAAAELYAKERPDLVLLDIVMPIKSGIDALRSIRASDPQARVLMVSAVGQEVIVKEALGMGAAGFVVKPFDEAQLLNAVKKASGEAIA